MKKKPPPPTPALLKYSEQQLRDLDANVRALRESGIETIAEASMFCAAASEPDATIGRIVKQLGMPFSTASRIAYSLLERGVLKYAPHPTDRRKKIVTANVEQRA